MKSTKSCTALPQDAAGPSHRPWLAARSGVLVLGALAVLHLAGCEGDQIRDYKVPKQKALEPRADRQGHGGRHLLAVIAPRGEQTWFFKLVGPTAAVDTQLKTFDRFLQSIHFEGGEPRWTVPEGWKEQRGGGLRYATLRHVRIPLEITVVMLGRESAKLRDNIDRWRRQDLGLAPIGPEELEKVTHDYKIDGEPATLVNMASEAEEEPAAPNPGAAAPIRYKAPKGWKTVPPQGGFAVVELHLAEGGQQTRITITPFPGAAGGLLRNVNRWRGEVGLGPIEEKQLSEDVRKAKVDGIGGDYVDLSAPGVDADRKRTLAVSVPRGGKTWFFKMMGPADLVGKQKAAFEEFLKSVKFGGRGGADE